MLRLKLVAAPLAALGFVTLLTLEGDPGRVVILQAAMPAADFTSLIALEHDLEPDYVTSVVLVGTPLSAVTLPVVISLLLGERQLGARAEGVHLGAGHLARQRDHSAVGGGIDPLLGNVVRDLFD